MRLTYLRYRDPERRLREYERGLSELYLQAISRRHMAEARAICARRERVRRAAHREREPIAAPHAQGEGLDLHELPIAA